MAGSNGASTRRTDLGQLFENTNSWFSVNNRDCSSVLTCSGAFPNFLGALHTSNTFSFLRRGRGSGLVNGYFT